MPFMPAMLMSMNTKVGTLTSGWEHFFDWKRVANEDEAGKVSLERALRGLSPELPILLIGGDGDDKVTPQSVRSLFTSLPMSEGTKELWIVPGAHHGDAWRVVPKEYGARLQAFLQRCR